MFLIAYFRNTFFVGKELVALRKAQNNKFVHPLSVGCFLMGNSNRGKMHVFTVLVGIMAWEPELLSFWFCLFVNGPIPIPYTTSTSALVYYYWTCPFSLQILNFFQTNGENLTSLIKPILHFKLHVGM